MAEGDDNKPNPAETFQKLLAQKNNDATALASQLFDENFQLRVKNRELTDKQPKEGSVVLSADDAKKWNAYEALGVEPKELKKSLERLPDLEKSNKELAGMEHLREVADIGIEGSKIKLSVLQKLMAEHPDAAFTFKTEKDKDGNEAKVAYIKPSADGTESSFTEFANQNFADFLPALKVSSEAQQPVPNGNTGDPKPQGGPTSFFDRLKGQLTEERKATATPAADIDARFGRPAQV